MARAYASAPRNWHLHIDHSVSSEQQAICDHELRLLAARSGRFTFNLRVTRLDGRLNAPDVEAFKQKHPEGLFYVCGGRAYVESVKALLTRSGVADRQIRIELFSPVG